MRRIGVDVGGTNTDAVLVDGSTVVVSHKAPTTPDVTSGVATALQAVLAEAGDPQGDDPRVDAVMIGTTHFTNAVVEQRGLNSVAAVRIGLPASASLPPFVDWPEDLARVARAGVYMVAGGHEYDGRPIVPFDSEAMREVAASIRESGVTSVAVTSVFSPMTAECEEAALEILLSEAPDLRVTLSHPLGRIGLLERENAALLNAALADLAEKTVSALLTAVEAAGLACPLLITLNDGTVATTDTVTRYPVLSFASGPTNSMRGAAFLSGMDDALVADVGGTTTDVGCLVRGFPREANNAVEVGGVRTLFRMPDLLSVGLGGGSIVGNAGHTVGPESVGYRIREAARVFGGSTWTATDVGAVLGWVDLGGEASERARALMGEASHGGDGRTVGDDWTGGHDWAGRHDWAAGDGRTAGGSRTSEGNRTGELCRTAAAMIHQRLAEAVDRMKTEARPEPLIAVGGGSFLIPDQLAGISEVIRVPFHEVANAVGAAIAQVSGEVDQVFQDHTRDEAIQEALAVARDRAVSAGADPATLSTVDVEDLPLAYLPGHALRVRAKVVGDVAAAAGRVG